MSVVTGREVQADRLTPTAAVAATEDKRRFNIIKPLQTAKDRDNGQILP
jgi:hypothetical protein